MCEDLGSTHDYDFNDLVYDVYYTGTSGNYTANIKIQAVGGTLPIYLGGYWQEIHELMGFGKNGNMYYPINVGVGYTAEPKEIKIYGLSTTNPDDIDIVINTPISGDSRPKNTFTLPKVNKTSIAPQKICIPGNTTKWTKEYQQIEWAYPHFEQWVNNMNGMYRFPIFIQDGTGWKLTSTYAATGASWTPWTITDVDSRYLYK